MSITTTGVEGIDEPLAAPAEPVAQIDPYPLASAARSNEPPWASPRVAWFTISMVGLVTMFGQMDRAIFYLLVSSIKRDLHLTDTHISLLMGAAYSAAYFCVGLPMARLTDVGKRKFILPGALALWSLGTFLCAMSSGFISFFAARSIVGAGESVKGPGSVSIISDVLPRDKLSRGFALYNLSIRGGEAIAQILGGLLIGLFTTTVIVLPFLGELHGWHLVFMIFGLPGVLFAILFMITVPEPARHGRRSSASMPLREVAHFLFKSPARKVLLPILFAAAITNIEVVGIGSWRPAFYERTYGWTPAQFAPILGIAGLIITPIALFAGAWLSERLARKGYADANMRLVVWAQIAGLPIGIISPLMPNFPLAMACSLLSTFLVTASAPSQLAAMQVVTPNELRGQVNALYLFTLSVIGQGLGPTVIALMTDNLFSSEADLRYAMVTAAAVAGPIALWLINMTLKPYGEAYRRSTEEQARA
jgi:MFS family permease